jgi:glutamate racemase
MSIAPIGVFDSGIGGLTVAKAVSNLLPQERLIYFGDTAHLPYGDKSTAAIQSYAVKICDLLLKHHCKVILIACNSASAAAFELAREYVGSKAKVLNVIDPLVEYVGEKYPSKTIGMIGTQRTVSSNVYQKKIDKLSLGITLKSLATKLLVPMIEEGYFQNSISKNIIYNYLSDEHLSDIDALILGCTHYPLIKHEIETFYQNKIEIIDASNLVAENLKNYLTQSHLLNDSKQLPSHTFYVSDYTKSFVASTKIFFGEELNLQHYPLWE